jgi:hypothetical protein
MLFLIKNMLFKIIFEKRGTSNVQTKHFVSNLIGLGF